MYSNKKYALVFKTWDGDRVILCENEEELEIKKIEYSVLEDVAIFKVMEEKNNY